MEKTTEGRSSSDNAAAISGKILESPLTTSNDRPASKDDDAYLPNREAIPIICALGTAFFLVTLDRNILATVIPQITDEFHSIEDIGWYASAYMLTGSSFVLLFGKIYTFYPPKWVLLIAISLFEIGSAICGSAPNSIAFIIGRAVAGWGFAGIYIGGTVTLQRILPLHKRPMVMGMMGAVSAISSVAGPIIGGALATKISWRWCFYINLPVGGLAMGILALLLKATAPVKAGTTFKTKLAQLDPLGTLCFLPSIVCLILALQWGGSQYAWSNARIIVLLVLFAILLTCFIIIQIWKGEQATVPPHVFKQRSIVCGFIFSICLGSSMALMTYYLPIWFQAILGVDALHSGYEILPFLLSLTATALVAGFTVSKLGYYVPHMILSSVFMSIGAGLMTTFTPSTPKAQWIGYQILFGIGSGLGAQQTNVAAQAVLPRKDIAIGSALMMFGSQMSGAIFVPIGQSVFENHLLKGINGIAGVDGEAILNTGATELRGVVGSEVLESVLGVYDKALTQVYLVAVVVAALAVLSALGMEWKSVKKDKKADQRPAKVEDGGVSGRV
ncbi:hypothetical protein G7Y89_g520 [Cudoniella acicularis]|uniref:Major facilitator superfamily (MFS) profile domain-containing protein n=1 Tax=Cudoniella acicularis TaxID=354080 RepID=A0A8H4RYL8_9HELO|nr:hypothetical protein G7Y89_g520 [Cudoniella acicularis]